MVSQVCFVLEADLWGQADMKRSEDNDELNGKIAVLQERTSGFSYDLNSMPKGQLKGEAEHDDLLDQVCPTRCLGRQRRTRAITVNACIMDSLTSWSNALYGTESV